MPLSKSISRSLSKDSDKLSFRTNRTNSLKSSSSSARTNPSVTKFKQKILPSSIFKPEDSSKSSTLNSFNYSKDSKKNETGLNSQKLDGKVLKSFKDTKLAPDFTNKSVKQLTLSKSGSFDTGKKLISKGTPSSIDYEDSDKDSETPRGKGNKAYKRSGSVSSSKSTPTKLTSKRPALDGKNKTYSSIETDEISHDSISLNHDYDLDFNISHNKVPYLNNVSKNSSINHSLVNGSSVDTLYSTLNTEDDLDRMNDEFRFKRSKRSHYKLQDSILGLISKYQSDLEHLDDKIKLLESQFFSNPPETTGLIKGWEGNVLNNAYTNISTGLKSRRALNAKLKANFTQTQNLITEHIFSLTSSTCAVSKMLLNESSKLDSKGTKKGFVQRLRDGLSHALNDISANDKYPLSYLEFRESEYKISKERKEIIKKIGASIRDKCRPEIDEYVNCCAEKNFIIFNCKNESKELHRCIRHYQLDATSPESIRKIIEERFEKGETSAIPSYLKDPKRTDIIK